MKKFKESGGHYAGGDKYKSFPKGGGSKVDINASTPSILAVPVASKLETEASISDHLLHE
jgi:hypothetical protein